MPDEAEHGSLVQVRWRPNNRRPDCAVSFRRDESQDKWHSSSEDWSQESQPGKMRDSRFSRERAGRDTKVRNLASNRETLCPQGESVFLLPCIMSHSTIYVHSRLGFRGDYQRLRLYPVAVGNGPKVLCRARGGCIPVSYRWPPQLQTGWRK